MLASEKLIKIAKTMSEDVPIEIVDFAENLINNMTKEQVKLIDEFIDENEVALRELSK